MTNFFPNIRLLMQNINLPTLQFPQLNLPDLFSFSSFNTAFSVNNPSVWSNANFNLPAYNMDTFSFGGYQFSGYPNYGFGFWSAPVSTGSGKKSKPAKDGSFTLNLSASQTNDLKRIKTIFNNNKSKYEAVSRATGVPAELICAIHWRESGCNFGTYLHNGDPLGKPTTHVPKGKFFTNWTDAAIDAIKSQGYCRQVKSNDIKTQYEYAERFNGLGYRKHGVASPYVWSGTSKYSSGKYVADGKYNAGYKDKQVGVAAILDALYQA